MSLGAATVLLVDYREISRSRGDPPPLELRHCPDHALVLLVMAHRALPFLLGINIPPLRKRLFRSTQRLIRLLLRLRP